MYKCDKCNKEFKSEPALRGHQRVHSDNYEASQAKHGQRLRNVAKLKGRVNEEQYLQSPNLCPYCNSIIPYKDYVNKKTFCDSSCAAKYNNRKRGPRSEETKQKTSQTMKNRQTNTNRHKMKTLKKENLPGPYSRVFFNVCSHCKTNFSSRTKAKYCSVHAQLYKSRNRNRYAFTFSLGNYPNLFGHMSNILAEVGMWSPKNINGLTRDHRVSVNEAIRNNYDPYYIKHPLNCELMCWNDNNKKNTTSSISYGELKQMVDEYENNKLLVLKSNQSPLD